MFKKRSLVVLIAIALSSSAYAGKASYFKDYKNLYKHNHKEFKKPFFVLRRPFQALQNQIDSLQEQIDANKLMIQSNQEAIVSLEDQLNQFDFQVSEFVAFVESISLRVQANADEIALLREDVLVLSTSVDHQALTLSELKTQHEADLAAIRLDMALAREEIQVLFTTMNTMVEELRGEMTALRQAVSDDAIAIDGLLVSVALVSSQVVDLSVSLQGQQLLLDTLTTRMNTAETSIQEIGVMISELENRSTDTPVPSSGLPCGPAGEGCGELPWVYVDEVNGLAWAWASPCSGACSTPVVEGVNGNLQGWRFPTNQDWAVRPDPSVWGGGAIIQCAAPQFDPNFNHCDWNDGTRGSVVQAPDNGFGELWLVHDL